MNNKELKPNSKSKIKTLTSDYKGITLIALVITIIVMLILVAVTVTIAINGGLFKTAKQAKADTQANIDAEQRLASGRIKVDGEWYDSLEDYTKGKKSENQSDVQGDEPQTSSGDWKLSDDGNTVSSKSGNVTLNIGDYVNYKPVPATTTYSKDKLTKDYTGNTSSSHNNSDLTTESLNWRVLGVDEKGCLTLISDKPTTKTVYFEDAKGYNNGVYILNDICEKLYSNTKLGIKARSLTIEDIEAGFKEETGIAERNKYTYADTQYGKTKTYNSKLNYPILYNLEKGSGVGTTTVKEKGIEGSDPYYGEDQLIKKPEDKESDTASSNLTCTQTYYYFSPTPKNYCKNSEFYDMIFNTDTYYWLASRYVSCYSGYAYFGLRYVGDADLGGHHLFFSNGLTHYDYSYLRPVVSLGSNISIETVDNNSDTNPHKIPGLE